MLSKVAAGGFSTGLGCSRWSTHPDQKSTEVTLDLAWSRQAVRARMLPGEADLREQWTSQPELPARASHQPGPAIGCARVARAHGGPAQGLLPHAEHVFDVESSEVGLP